MSKDLGPNDFIVSDEDIADMVNCLEACLRRGPTFKTIAHEEYLAGPFRRRHPEIYEQYIAQKRVEPITKRQFQYYVDNNAQLSDELARNLRTRKRNPGGYLGSVRAAGPSEVYEIDATGGRLFLVSSEDPSVVLRKPTIYIIIDRWSRFIVAIYISLRPPSYEEVRYALLIAFTSRTRRFQALGADTDDERWPVGRMPAVLCCDRGAEFMSESMETAVVQDLRIELTPLPPLCPDGKAIVERTIRELKRRMASSGIKGTYADRPLDPHSKRAARKAMTAAVHRIADAYRTLIRIVDDHNNRPHSALKRKRVLSQAGVQPIPKEAYLWGLKNKSGLRVPPLPDADYRRLLLSVDTASIAKGVLRYKGRPYKPDNEAAIDFAAKSTGRAKKITIRVDKSEPHEVFVPISGEEWAIFLVTPGGASELAGLSLDEEEALADQTVQLWARAEHESRRKRVEEKGTKTKGSKERRPPSENVDRHQKQELEAQETRDMKRQLTGHAPVDRNETGTTSTSGDWRNLEEQERLKHLDLIRRHRRKK